MYSPGAELRALNQTIEVVTVSSTSNGSPHPGPSPLALEICGKQNAPFVARILFCETKLMR
jgi:hypothetical protein